MLLWHRRLWLIDHGACLYFHHAWDARDRHATSSFAPIKDHVLLKYASALHEVKARMSSLLTADKLAALVRLIPDSWLADEAGFDGRSAQRAAYLNYFLIRLDSSDIFVEEAIRARSSHL
jgi:hypothetical protein